MTNKETRRVSKVLQTRAAKDSNSAGVLYGMPICANSRSQFMGFYEVISPDAIRKAILPDADIALFHSHDASLVLSRTSAGTMRTWVDINSNARFEADIANTQAGRDLIVSVTRKEIVDMSFGFTATKDNWSLLPNGDALRTILEMQVIEYSAVYEGAYKKPTISLDATLRNCPRDIAHKVRTLAQRASDDDSDAPNLYCADCCDLMCDDCRSSKAPCAVCSAVLKRCETDAKKINGNVARSLLIENLITRMNA